MNRLALQGWTVTDHEVCAENNLDMKLVGTKKINNAMCEKQAVNNERDLIRVGYPPEKAKRLAGQRKALALKQCEELYKLKGI